MSVTTECRWKDCCQKFGDIVEMLSHIHNDHLELSLEDVNRILAEREKKVLQNQVQQLSSFFKSLQCTSPQLFQCLPDHVQQLISVIPNSHVLTPNNNLASAPKPSPPHTPQLTQQQQQPQPQPQPQPLHQSELQQQPQSRPQSPQNQPQAQPQPQKQPQSSTNVQQQPVTSQATIHAPPIGRPTFPAHTDPPTSTSSRSVFGKLENLRREPNPGRVNRARPRFQQAVFYEPERKFHPRPRKTGFYTQVGNKLHCNWQWCNEVSNNRTRANVHYRRDHLKVRRGKAGRSVPNSKHNCIELH